jgi:foldase protein PrsA
MVSLALSTMVLSQGLSAPGEEDTVVARVNGRPIYLSELTKRVLQDYGATVLDRMIVQALVEQEAEALGIKVSEQEIESQFQEYLKSLQVGTPADQALAEAGIGREGLRAQLITALRLKKMVAQNVQPTAQEIEDRYQKLIAFMAYYTDPDRYRISAIFVKDRAKALKVMELLRQGADFATVAKQYSEDASAELGGDFGWRDVGEMENFLATLKEINAPPFPLRKGEMSDLIQTAEGYRIFKVTDFRAGKRMSPKEAREKAKEMLIEERLQGEMNRKLNSLKEKAQIEKSPEFIR